MENSDILNNIFYQTKTLLGLWTTMGVEYNDNDQVSHILYYLSLTAGYLKGKDEAKIFEKRWNEVKDTIKEGSNQFDWLNQGHMIKSHLEQALREESVHHPNRTDNLGIERFYSEIFPGLYSQAKEARDDYVKKQENIAKGMGKHHEDIFSSQEKWEEALRRGDPMVLVD